MIVRNIIVVAIIIVVFVVGVYINEIIEFVKWMPSGFWIAVAGFYLGYIGGRVDTERKYFNSREL